FGVSASLFTVTAMFDPAQEMRSSQHLQTTVLARVGIHRDKDRRHVGEQTTVLIPVTVVLMPGPRAAGARFLDAHLGMVMIDFVAKQLLHGIDDPVAARDRSV